MRLLLLPLAAALFLYGIWAGDLYRTESLRASVGAEILRGGSLVTPTLHGEPLLTKPPLMYLAIAAVSWPVGEVTPWSARLPAVLAALASLLVFHALFAGQLGRGAGLAAALLLPMSLLWLDRASAAEIDMLQLFWVTASLACFLMALRRREERVDGPATRPEHFWMQLALLGVAGGILTKWTAPAFFYLTVIPLLLWRGRLRLLLEAPHLLAAFSALALCAGWGALAVHEAGWETFRDTVRREALLRLSPAHHPRAYPWGELVTFPVAFLLACLPGAVLAPLVFRRGFRDQLDDNGRRLWQLLHCWAWANLLFWTLVPGHRPRHCLPLQPALAGLGALGWLAWQRGQVSLRLGVLTPRRLLAGMLACWLVVKLVHVHVVIPFRQQHARPSEAGRILAESVPPGATIHIVQLKDDGVLFHSGRPALRVPSLAEARAGEQGCYCLLTAAEWQAHPRGAERACVLAHLRDSQGDPMVLLHLGPQ